MNGRNIVILIVAGGAAFGLFMLWWARAVDFPHHPPQPIEAAADRVPALADKPAAVPAAENTAQPATAVAPASRENSSLPETEAQKSNRLMQAALAIQHQNAQRYATALARWANEKRDPAWAAARERALRAALDSDRVQIAPDQLECRATLCRISLRPPNALEGAPAMRAEIGKQSAVGSDGSGAARSLILFIPREGQKLDG